MTQPTLNTQQIQAPSTDHFEQLSLEQQKFQLQLELSRRAQQGQPIRVESLFEDYPSLREKPELLLHLIGGEISIRTNLGESVEFTELEQRFPHLSESVTELLSSTPSEMGAIPPPGESVSQDAATLQPTGQETIHPSPTVQREIAGYQIEGELGRGGMGVVYKARQKGLNRLVALKMILHADHAGSDERLRFEREAQAIARLDHPNIVQIYEIGEHEGKPFFSLEFVTGGDLAGKLKGKPMSAMEAASMVETLARGMQVAHQADVIHRDLKPANVLMTEEGVPKITDFGLAKTLDEAGQTQSGAIMGTPSYMAPEQAAGKTQSMGPTVDVYALGAILYDCLTGRPPFRAASAMDTVMQVISLPPTPPSQHQVDIPRDLETICLKCLEKESGKRYETAELLAEDLQRFQNGEPILARPVTQLERFWRWCKRSPMVASLLLLVIVVLLAGTGISTWFGIQSRENAKRAEWEATEAKKAQAVAQRRQMELAEEKKRSDQQTELAEKQKELAEVRLYASQLAQAQQAWKEGNTKVAFDLLDGCQWDLRHFEHRYLWTLFNSNQVTLKGHTTWVRSVAFSPDGKQVVSGSNDRTLKLWNGQTGQQIHTLVGHGGNVTSVSFSPDGKHIISGSSDGTLKMWGVQTGQEVRTFHGHSALVCSVVFSPDGKFVASGSFDKSIKIWDVNTAQEVIALQEHTATVYSVAFSFDGQRIVSGSGDKTLKVWDAKTGEAVLTLAGHQHYISGVAFSPDGKCIVSGSDDKTLKMWDVETEQIEPSFRGHHFTLTSVAFSPDGKRIVSGSADKTIKMWETKTGQVLHTFTGHTDCVTGVAFSPGGKWIVSGSEDSTLKRWDAKTGEEILTLKGHTSGVTSVAISPDGQSIISGSWDRTLKLWNAQTGTPLLTLNGSNNPVHCVAFSPNGKRIVSGNFEGRLTVWDSQTGKRIFTLDGHTKIVRCVTFSPTGNCIVSGSDDGTLRMWNAKTGQVILTLQGHTDNVMSVTVSPAGKRIISGSADSTLKIWDAKTGQWILTLQGHSDSVQSVAICPDGQRIASGSNDYTLKLWDATNNHHVFSVKANRANVKKVIFSDEGKQINISDPDVHWHEKEANQAHETSNHFAEAFHLKHLLKYHPWRTDLHVRRAFLLEKMNRPQQAIGHYLTAILDKPTISLTPLDPTARTRGHNAAKEEKWNDAVNAFSLAVQQPKATVHDWYALMLCQLATEDLQGYQQSVSEMLERYELSYSLLYYSVSAPCSVKDAERLIEYAGQLKQTASVLQQIGALHYYQGNYTDALQAFQKSLKLQGKGGFVDTWLFLAMLYHKQNKWNDAQKWMDKVEDWAKKTKWRSWQDKLRWQHWLKQARQVLSTVPPMPKADS